MPDANEATLVIVRKYAKEEKLYIFLQKDISGEEASGCIDYIIKGEEDFMRIAEENHVISRLVIFRISKQLESLPHTNRKKRTADQVLNDGCGYLYNIVSFCIYYVYIGWQANRDTK